MVDDRKILFTDHFILDNCDTKEASKILDETFMNTVRQKIF
jgi:hypothetical protein